MQYERLNIAIPKFVEEVVQWHRPHNRTLTVIDLRNAIRRSRMSEFSDWSGNDLDALEVHAAGFDGNAPLESVLEISTNIDLKDASISVGLISAPSPFAWL